MKRTLWGLLVAAAVGWAGFWVYEELVDSFYESAIHLHTWPKAKYDTLRCQYSVNKVRKIVEQPFTYLGKGRQFFVFESADKKYVLKFIKCQRVDMPDLYKETWLPDYFDQMRKMRLKAKQERIDGMFFSVALAATRLAENTGVVFAHLSTNPAVMKKIELIDKLGVHHSIELDEVPFVLQQKADGVIPTFTELLDAGDDKMVRKRFNQLIALILSDAKAGVVDKDSGTIVRGNVAFLSDRAIHVDIGTFEPKQDAMGRANLEEQLSHLDPLIDWIATKNPKLAAELEAKIQAVIQRNCIME